MNRPETPRLLTAIEDVQGSPDIRRLPIDQVGVRGLRYPVRVEEGDGDSQSTIGTWELSIALPEHLRGAHMSRFIAMLDDFDAPLSAARFGAFAEEVGRCLESDAASVSVRFPYFRRKAAPVSGVQSLMDYEARFDAWVSPGANTAVELTVIVPVTALCPCSKSISDYGAHNQRSHVTIAARVSADVRLHELVGIAESEASCELYGVLKRPDEKYVTERAYDNPKFVEDLVRDVARRLDADERIVRYRVEVENFESIHNHSAYAILEGPRRAA